MKLVYKDTGKEVQKGDILTSSRGKSYIAKYWREPDHGVGKISVIKNPEDKFWTEYYVSVFGLEWRDECLEKKTIIMEWSSEDVKSIAECAGIELSDQDVNKICEDLVEKFNNSDYLNDYISGCIAEAVKKYER